MQFLIKNNNLTFFDSLKQILLGFKIIILLKIVYYTYKKIKKMQINFK